MSMESEARADTSFGVTGARTGTAALKLGIPPVARSGLQILGMVLDGPLGEPCGKWRR